MKKLFVSILFAFVLVSLSQKAFAFDDWSKRDILLQATYTTLHVIDWGQTRYIASNPDKYYEKNPLLGRHPDKDTVDIYFVGTLIAHTAITHILPSKYRPWWQVITIGVEATMVGLNYNLGIKTDF